MRVLPLPCQRSLRIRFPCQQPCISIKQSATVVLPALKSSSILKVLVSQARHVEFASFILHWSLENDVVGGCTTILFLFNYPFTPSSISIVSVSSMCHRIKQAAHKMYSKITHFRIFPLTLNTLNILIIQKHHLMQFPYLGNRNI